MAARPEPLNITLRENLIPSDREPLEQLMRESTFFRDDEIPVAMELIDDQLAKGKASEYLFIVAVQDDKPVGYVCYGLIACSVHSYDIYWIAVSPKAQRSGIGRRLMTAAEERIQSTGGRRVYVDTSGKAQYHSTRAFYLKCRYSIEATLHDFYAPGDDKVIFLKVLGTEDCRQ